MSLADELLNSIASGDESTTLVPGENIFDLQKLIDDGLVETATINGEECFSVVGDDYIYLDLFEPGTQYAFSFEAIYPGAIGAVYFDDFSGLVVSYTHDPVVYRVWQEDTPYDQFHKYEWVSPKGPDIYEVKLGNLYCSFDGISFNSVPFYIKTNMTIRPLVEAPVEPEQPEEYIIINPDRTVVVPEDLKKIAVQFDHNIETVTFECPRYWDGLDMSQMNVYINYIRSDNHTNSYPTEVISADEETMRFKWTISNDVTQVKGEIAFLVCVKKVVDGEEVNHWNSELCRDCYISEGLEAETVIAEQYPDIITQLLTGPISPEVSIEVIDGGHRVVVTDITGTKQFDVKDGKDGPKGEPGYINLDDDVVGEHAWSSKNIVDRLCPVLDETGSMVTCNPVAGYPLNVISHIVPYQAGSETPALDNIRPISGYDEIILTHNDTQHNAELTQTVYGGSLDWSTGQFISDMEYMVLTGNETWGTLSGVGIYSYVYLTVGTYGYINTKIKATCSHCAATSIGSGNNNLGVYAANSSGYHDARILFRLEGVTNTLEAWTAFLKDQYAKGTPVSVAYGITAPTTTQFDPEEIIATTGINTLQSNTGDTTVTGRKDPIAVIEQLTTMLTSLTGGV